MRAVVVLFTLLNAVCSLHAAKSSTWSIPPLKSQTSLNIHGKNSISSPRKAALGLHQLPSADLGILAAKQKEPLVIAQSKPKFGVPISDNVRLAGYVVIWYGLSLYYNAKTKRVLEAFPAPYTVSAVHFLMGVCYASTLWLTGYVQCLRSLYIR